MSVRTDVAWRLDAYAGHWLTDDELTAVTDWMAANGLDRATAERPVVVEHGTVTYGQDRSLSHVRSPHRDIVAVTMPLRTAPPTVQQPTCAPEVLAELQETFRHHEWSAGFGGVCVDCSEIQVDESGRVWCRRDDAVQWPCPPVWRAMYAAGMPVPPLAGHQVILGSTLDPADNARVFGSPTQEGSACTEQRCLVHAVDGEPCPPGLVLGEF